MRILFKSELSTGHKMVLCTCLRNVAWQVTVWRFYH